MKRDNEQEKRDAKQKDKGRNMEKKLEAKREKKMKFEANKLNLRPQKGKG